MNDNSKLVSNNTNRAEQTSTTRSYEVSMTLRCEKEFLKQIKKDSNGIEAWVDSVMKELASNPTFGAKLSSRELPGYRSVHSKDNNYRIIYKADEFPEPKVLVIAIGHRENIYGKATREAQLLRSENQ
ncbi:MAG TPA: type II toxin-antitoxin system RelE/ParE family toxin [Candidatus Acidoferrales bacterium]|nr:type II toxin-antitoxin system RelE/ParE family toxin [Candidatus Acidoferrales bacterium]